MKDGFDSEKRWGNSALKGHGVNSPAMMQARKGFHKAKALSKAKEYITAPSGRKFEITKSKSMGHQNIDYKHKE